MKSYLEIVRELTSAQEREDVPSVITIITDALEPFNQKKELRMALFFLRNGSGAGNNIFHHSCIVRSNALRKILKQHDLIPLSFYTSKNRNGYNALALAVQNQDYNFVKSSFKNGANPNELTNGESLLVVAGRTQDLTMIRLLINYKADVPQYGVHCLFHLIIFNPQSRPEHQKERAEIMQLLINHGAKILTKNNRGLNLLNFVEASACIKISDEEMSVLKKETKDRNLLNKTLHLFLLGNRYDRKSNFYGLPEEITKEIASYTRNQK